MTLPRYRTPTATALVTIAFVAFFANALHAQENWPKGIDPSSLLLNTEPEPETSGEGFVELFNGKDLSGWAVKGSQMEFYVDDGEIVGTCTPDLRPNSFLCTEEDYSNFVFTAEFKWDVLGNSGIMFRADTQEPDANGVERVYGYQSEMDPSDRAWTGGIYGEVMKGWKYPLFRDTGHAAARSAIDDYHSWNRMTIYANGNEIRTWINGVPTAFLIDNDRESGFFGLQVHSGDKGTIRWRNIRVKELDETITWKSLFPEDNFSHWTHTDGSPVSEEWTIENGIITREKSGSGDIVTKDSYRNFELRFDWKISKGGNSGVKYRTRGNLGLEYQVLDDERHLDGKLVTHRSGDLYDLKAAISKKPIQPVGEWNNSRILANGNHIQHFLNGQKIVEIELDSEEWRDAFQKSKYSENVNFGRWTGPILLQDHGDVVQFRNLQIRRL